MLLASIVENAAAIFEAAINDFRVFELSIFVKSKNVKIIHAMRNTINQISLVQIKLTISMEK